MSHLSLFLLGPPRIEREGEPVGVGTRKAIALVAYLALAERRHSREGLATLLWPKSDQSHARAALRQALSVLKKALGGEWIKVERDSLALKRGGEFWMDVDHFHDLLAACQGHGHPAHHVCPTCFDNLTKAVALYRDDLLAGFTLRDCPDFDEWRFFESERLREMLNDALEKLVRYHAARQEYIQAIACAQRWLALDELNETAHQCLIQLYAQDGRRPAALRQYQECERILQREIGLPPQKETAQLYWAVRRKQALWPMVLPTSLSARPHNLVLQPTPFFGREDELAYMEQMLDDSDCRLVTLTGPAGAGKTRLAIQAAWQIASEKSDGFSHGIYLASLAPLDSPDSLAPTIADAIGFSLHSSKPPKDQLIDYLRAKDMLLILDNFEHLLDGAGLLAEILGNAPAIKLLVTSRERLGLQWEWPLEIQGLEVPQNDGASALKPRAAEQVFLHSARRADPKFAFEIERPHVAHICRYLEGIPLAIELAAAWVEAFPCQEIAQEIEHNLGLLAVSSREPPERHQSLRAAFDHSWNLLAEEERDLFAKLSVFRGGFSREASEAVAGASLRHLSALMHKSLLQKEAMGRYRMLQVLRQYAEEKLGDTPEWVETHDRHCAYYTGFLHQREENLRGRREQETLKEITQEVENVRAGWHWAVAHRKRDAIVDAMQSLFLYYRAQNWHEEGEWAFGIAANEWRKIVDEYEQDAPQGANAGPSNPRVILGGLLARQGCFCYLLSHYEEAQRILEESLACLRFLGSHRDTALALSTLGAAAMRLGDHVTARRLYQESLAMYKELGDQWGVVGRLNNMGVIAWVEGDLAQAREYFQESLTIFTDLGDQQSGALVLNNLGAVAKQLGEYAEAERLYQQALSRCRERDDRWTMAICLDSLGLLAEAMGKYKEAKQALRQGLAFFQEIGHQLGETNCLNNLGFVLVAEKEYELAGEHFCTALRISTAAHLPDMALHALVGIGFVIAQAEERRECAVELAAHALSHPLASLDTKERAERLISELESQVPAPVFAAAQERGKQGDLEYYVSLCETQSMSEL
jgi:predicted ATPase/DNA-binding SARP family transcriptional activator